MIDGRANFSATLAPHFSRLGSKIGSSSLLCLCLLLASGCQRIAHGPANADEAQVRPDQVRDFEKLYGANCAGCHGVDGKNGPAIAMNNPVYMAIASDEQIRNITVNGQPGTLMPAFGQSAGGLLTGDQIGVIVAGMRQRWGQKTAGLNPPTYTAQAPGDLSRGRNVYAYACASCHGAAADNAQTADRSEASSQSTGQGVTQNPAAAASKYGSVSDPTFLALLSDQSLRTIVIAGRPDLGHPDWRGDIPGRALSEQEVTDVVAWLGSHRNPVPGQTHPAPARPGATELQRRVQ